MFERTSLLGRSLIWTQINENPWMGSIHRDYRLGRIVTTVALTALIGFTGYYILSVALGLSSNVIAHLLTFEFALIEVLRRGMLVHPESFDTLLGIIGRFTCAIVASAITSFVLISLLGVSPQALALGLPVISFLYKNTTSYDDAFSESQLQISGQQRSLSIEIQQEVPNENQAIENMETQVDEFHELQMQGSTDIMETSQQTDEPLNDQETSYIEIRPQEVERRREEIKHQQPRSHREQEADAIKILTRRQLYLEKIEHVDARMAEIQTEIEKLGDINQPGWIGDPQKHLNLTKEEGCLRSSRANLLERLNLIGSGLSPVS